MKYVSIDTETTGLDTKLCQVVEFAAVLDDLKKPLPIDELPVFHCYIDNRPLIGEPYAMFMNAEILRRIDKREEGYTYYKPEELGPAFKAWLEANSYNRKCDHAKDSEAVLANVAGKNFASFDFPMLDRMPNFSENVQFSRRQLDPGIFYLLADDFRIPDMQTAMQRAKITGVVAHTAAEDAKIVIQLIRRGM
jgi:oligoribonuclease